MASSPAPDPDMTGSLGPSTGPMTDQQALVASAQRLGLAPEEWGGLMHFESGMDPSRWGGAGGRHVGLIQFGPNEQKQFGVTGNESFQEQLPKAEAFLQSRGYQPGMGLAQAYSTINAGSPGRLDASDAGNGGTWGTVADKVNFQFGPHIAAATKFLGGATAQMPGASSAPGRFGLGGVGQSAVPQVDPLSGQPIPASADGTQAPQGGAYDDIASLLKGIAPKQAQQGGQGGGQSQGGGGMQIPQDPGGRGMSVGQARQQFDPSRFYAMLPRRTGGLR